MFKYLLRAKSSLYPCGILWNKLALAFVPTTLSKESSTLLSPWFLTLTHSTIALYINSPPPKTVIVSLTHLTIPQSNLTFSPCTVRFAFLDPGVLVYYGPVTPCSVSVSLRARGAMRTCNYVARHKHANGERNNIALGFFFCRALLKVMEHTRNKELCIVNSNQISVS